jgi:hypothetical protein
MVLRHQAALASCQLTRGYPGGQPTPSEVIMSRPLQRPRLDASPSMTYGNTDRGERYPMIKGTPGGA